jgi:hypothetical protein
MLGKTTSTDYVMWINGKINVITFPFLFYFLFPLPFLFSFIFSFYFSPLSPPHPPVSLIAILTSASPFTPAGGSLVPAPAPLSRPCRRLAPRTRPWAPPLHAPPTEGGRRVEGGARRVAADAKGKEASPWPATTRSCRCRHLLHGCLPLPRGALPCRLPHHTELHRHLPCPPSLARQRAVAFQPWAPEGKGGSSQGGAAMGAGAAPPQPNRSSERIF